jgi:hypothetical protein
MTVYESIVNEFLNPILLELEKEIPHGYSIIEPEKIPLPEEYQGVNFQAGGIFSSPNDMTTPLMGGQLKHTDFKSFYLRRPFKEKETRIGNADFFERLARKIHERNLDWNMPKDGRDWKSIEINAGVYPANRDETSQWADYLIPLRLVYVE